jgi:hypothetical protein
LEKVAGVSEKVRTFAAGFENKIKDMDKISNQMVPQQARNAEE